MTRERMCKLSFRPYMVITYQTDRMPLAVDCLLAEINFDNETMILQPIHEFFAKEDFVANIKYCELHKKGLRAIK